MVIKAVGAEQHHVISHTLNQPGEHTHTHTLTTHTHTTHTHSLARSHTHTHTHTSPITHRHTHTTQDPQVVTDTPHTPPPPHTHTRTHRPVSIRAVKQGHTDSSGSSAERLRFGEGASDLTWAMTGDNIGR